MSRWSWAATLVPLLCGSSQGPALRLGFEEAALWTASASDGVAVSTAAAEGRSGPALAVAVDFHGGAGYAVVRRPLAVDLPDNWVLSFWVKGGLPPNNLEVKLIDDTGENVWWVNRRDFVFPADWTEVALRRRHFTFAWGRDARRPLRRISAIEFAVAAGSGGRGRVLLGDLRLAERPQERAYDRTPVVRASAGGGGGPQGILGPGAGWRSGPGARHWIEVDFLEPRELGGLVLRWEPERHATRYSVATSLDGQSWRTVRDVVGGNGGADFLALPETEARYVRLSLLESARRGAQGYALTQLEVMPLAFGTSANALVEAMAAEGPRGAYPRPFLRQQSYWTVLGVDGDTMEALLGEDGALEPWAGAFSIEPFVLLGGGAVSWADVEAEQRLEQGDLPLPIVTWSHPDLTLEIAPFAMGQPGASILVARYRLRPRSEAGRDARIVLAIRPLQVNPPSQFLNRAGGVASLRRIAWKGGRLEADAHVLVPLVPPTVAGVSSLDGGEIGEWITQGRVPPAEALDDPTGLASAALVFAPPGGEPEREVTLLVPMHGSATAAALEHARAARERPALVETWRRETAAGWRSALDRVRFRVPPALQPVVQTLRSNLAYILVNRDGSALQPGSRSYERSWIRDGALTSSALLRLGHAEAVRAFAEWFAPHQFANGKVPCCVDARGADPVPENDSHGELIFLAAEYWRFTGDRATLARLWPRVQAAVSYLESLRAETRTAPFRSPERLHLFGLLPPSISHEGYSDVPAYSYWDDFFALRGYVDAAVVAGALGHDEERARYSRMAEEFRADLLASIDRSRARFGVAYIPGAADRGDFDSTSTTIALSPGGLASRLPPDALRATFERYWKDAITRPERSDWDAYTPYEVRHIGAFVRLGWRTRASRLLGLFLKDRRPSAWNHWAEVVGRQPRAPRFIGDMPHGWVGSDFIRSATDLFCWWREEDAALVLGAGLDPAWLAGAGVEVEGLRTEHGRLDLALRGDGGRLEAAIGPGDVPPGGLVVTWPFGDRPRSALVNGAAADIAPDGSVVVRSRPARVVVRR